MRVRLINTDLKVVKEIILDIEKIISVNIDNTDEDVDILIREKKREHNNG
jgi:hypothetical protein